ncbi:hypothetical protein AAHC03_019250 [Spirometra sp. Aus1]
MNSPRRIPYGLMTMESTVEHRAYEAKLRELQTQALDIYGNYSTVAAQGDASSDGSSQHFPHIYPFPDLGFPSPLPLTPTASCSINCPPSTATYRIVDSAETPSRPSSEEDSSFEHSLPVPTPRHTDSLLRMAAIGQTFDIQLPKRPAAAPAQTHNGQTFDIVDEDPTDVDIARLPSLSSQGEATSEYTKAFSERPVTVASTRSPVSRLGQRDSLAERVSFSELSRIPSIRKMKAERVPHDVIELYAPIKTETCLSNTERQAFPRIHIQRKQAVLRPTVSVIRARSGSVTLRASQGSHEPLATPRRRRSAVTRVLRRIWRRLCSCVSPETE